MKDASRPCNFGILLISITALFPVGCSSPVEPSAVSQFESRVDAQVESELRRIEGDWEGVRFIVDGIETPPGGRYRYSFDGDQMTTQVDDAVLPRKSVTFHLDPTSQPKTLDTWFLADGKKEVSPGIYKIDGDLLYMCWRVGGERPIDFTTEDYDEKMKVILRRPRDNPSARAPSDGGAAAGWVSVAPDDDAFTALFPATPEFHVVDSVRGYTWKDTVEPRVFGVYYQDHSAQSAEELLDDIEQDRRDIAPLEQSLRHEVQGRPAADFAYIDSYGEDPRQIRYWNERVIIDSSRLYTLKVMSLFRPTAESDVSEFMRSFSLQGS